MKSFISYDRSDQQDADAIVELLRLHYIDFFLDRRSMRGGSISQRILDEIAACKKFILLLSPAAVKSDWVKRELAAAMDRDDLKGKSILPLMVKPTPSWQSLHPDLADQQMFDLTSDRDRKLTRIIEYEYKRRRHRHTYYQVGDVKIQVLIFAGGNGETRYRDGEIICDGPSDDRQFQLPADIASNADQRLAAAKVDCDARGAKFYNSPQVRLIDYSFGGPNQSGGGSDKPMRLKLGWTQYFHTRLTNQSRSYILPDGNSIELKYGRDLENLSDSGLSNPIAANMSVVTNDGKIFVATRSEKMAWNPGDFQPAVSGDGQPEDLDANGVYDPFHTAMREAAEECTGKYPLTREQVTIFGLARTMGTQFPFVFGEIRLPVSSDELLSYPPLNPEGVRIPIDFTIEGVCAWVEQYHLDHVEGSRSGVIGTTLFSLLQSLHYEYPDRWHEVIAKLKRG